MNRDSIPSADECYEIMLRYEMLPNIIEHSEQVMRVSLALVDNLRKDVIINRDLIIAASLLHDITKTQTLQTKEPHDKTGGELMRKLGFYQVAIIVEEHVIIKDFNFAGRLLEKELVYYSDKRVLHNRVVSVEERVADLVIRYGNNAIIESMIIENKKLINMVGEKINNHLVNGIDEVIINSIKTSPLS